MGTGCSVGELPALEESDIKVTIGSKVDTFVRRRMVIFVFGGPGSCMGRIVGDLAQGFGLQVIDAESIFLRQRNDSLEPTLENIMELVKKAIRNASSEAGFLIDLAPNRKGTEKALESSRVRDILETFEKDWPIAFALTLYGRFIHSTKAEQILMDMQVEGAHDERDADRIRKRCLAFASSVQPVISYFRDRTVRIHHDGVNYQRLWETVADLFWNLGFKTRGPVSTTVYFLLDKKEAIRLPQYEKETNLPRVPFILPPYLRARDIFDGVNAQIARQISPHRETFIAHLYPFMERIEWEIERKASAQKRLARPSVRYKQPLFLLPPPEDNGGASVERRRRFLATTHGDVCVFSADSDLNNCRMVAAHYAQAREAAGHLCPFD